MAQTGNARITALDQARGYAIAGMIAVNTLGHFDRMPWMVKHHHEGMSYADTIAPLFIFLVGMGFRMSFQRRAVEKGLCGARRARPPRPPAATRGKSPPETAPR